MNRGLFQRLLQGLFGGPVGEQARPEGRQRLAEPRGRVRAGTFICSACRLEFDSFVKLRGHICPGRVRG